MNSGQWVYHANAVRCRGGGGDTLAVAMHEVTVAGVLDLQAARAADVLARAALAESPLSAADADAELLAVGGDAEPSVGWIPGLRAVGSRLGASPAAQAHFTQRRCAEYLRASLDGEGRIELSYDPGMAPPAAADLANQEACVRTWFADAQRILGQGTELRRVAWRETGRNHYPGIDGRGRRCSSFDHRVRWVDEVT